MDSYVDVVIIGAGISGINFAQRLRESNPSLSLAILEGRDSVGGTWDFFKYPGIRSDSDLYTFGFSWYPWREDRAIADAGSIKQYLMRAIKYANIESCIRLNHKVVKADFSDKTAKWTLSIENNGHTTVSIHDFDISNLILSSKPIPYVPHCLSHYVIAPDTICMKRNRN